MTQIDQARYNEDYNQARNRITSRRWSGEPMLTGESSLESLQAHLSSALQVLDPQVIEARETIQRYVLSLSEQARAAAEQAEEAQQREFSLRANAVGTLVSSMRDELKFDDLLLVELLFGVQLRNKEIATMLGVDEKWIALRKHRFTRRLSQEVGDETDDGGR